MEADRTESVHPDAIELLEREQARWRDLEALLRRLLSRLTYAAEGRNAGLDGVLGSIRLATRNTLDEQRIRWNQSVRCGRYAFERVVGIGTVRHHGAA